MACISSIGWSEHDFCLGTSLGEVDEELATTVYDRVCRTDFHVPGFCLVNMGVDLSSQAFRSFMLGLEQRMRGIHQTRWGRNLVLMSAARFDQQVTTRPHRDGGPAECFLMLGYEPSHVRAELEMSDYSRCAHDMGLTPVEFLEKHNPMYATAGRLLKDYTTRVSCFSSRNYQLLLINNSSAPYSETVPAWQGVLHTATIQNPDGSLRRVVNSLTIASLPNDASDAVSEQEREDFTQTNRVRRRGYDQPTLEDDS